MTIQGYDIAKLELEDLALTYKELNQIAGQSTGDAMSPPVLGTMLALCMLYFFPANDDSDSRPLLSATQVSRHTVEVLASRDSESSTDTETVSVKPRLGPMAVSDIKKGSEPTLKVGEARSLASHHQHPVHLLIS